MLRWAAIAVGIALVAGACGGADPPVPQSTTTTAPTTIVSSTTTVPPQSTTAAATTTTAPTTSPPPASREFGVFFAPADGQWFNALPIPWLFSIEPPDTGPPPDPLPGSVGWTRDEAVVTVNGVHTITEPGYQGMYQPGTVVAWRTVDGVGDPYDWQVGENTVVFEATFADGVVVREERVFHYDPSLTALTGSIIDLDRETPAVTFAAAAREMGGDDAVEYGPVTSVETYPIRPDAAFILLEPHSGGQPPPTVITFDQFVALMDKSKAGDCDYCDPPPCDNQCFFAAGGDISEYDFTIYVTSEGELQQLEQDWSP